MNRALSLATNLFPIWVLAGGALALIHPPWFTWFKGEYITWGLAVIMLGMGITLSVDDFKRVLKMPRAVGIGFVAHYAIMPFLGWSIAHLLRLETPFAVGLILVSCCPCGTASNVVNYIARSNVALSVLMTMCSTMGAIVMTPLLTKWLAGQYVPVPAWGLFLSTVKIVLAPVIIGVTLNRYLPRLVKFILPVSPLVSVLTITLICASIIGGSAEDFKRSGSILLLAVFLLHSGGFLLGYFFSRLLRCDELTSRTISVEVGMQNSGLGAALAKEHFAQMPPAALPCAISATFHSVIGSLLAGLWRLRPASPRKSFPPGRTWSSRELFCCQGGWLLLGNPSSMELNSAISANGEKKAGIARGLCEQGLWPDVLAFAQKWREKEPADYRALYYIGLGLSGMRQFQEAEAAYRSALTLESTDVKVWNNLAGILYENLQRPVEAVRCLEQSLKMDPYNKLCWSNLATMVGRLGQHDKAMACADRAIALDPKLVEAYLHKGAAARALKKMDVVKEVCNKLASIEPENFRRAR